jgi:hypothetical protein
VRAWDLVVSLDFGQFYLTGNASGREAAFDPMPTLTRALEGDGIARTDGFLVVLSPHQHTAAMRLRVELYERRPPDDLADWEDAFAAWLPVDESGVVYESPTILPASRVPIPAGEYCLLITGRGFVAHGWTPTEPEDEWRIQLWPAAAPRDPRRLKAWQQPPAPARPAAPAAVDAAASTSPMPRGIRPFRPRQHMIDALSQAEPPPSQPE